MCQYVWHTRWINCSLFVLCLHKPNKCTQPSWRAQDNRSEVTHQTHHKLPSYILALSPSRHRLLRQFVLMKSGIGMRLILTWECWLSEAKIHQISIFFLTLLHLFSISTPSLLHWKSTFDSLRQRQKTRSQASQNLHAITTIIVILRARAFNLWITRVPPTDVTVCISSRQDRTGARCVGGQVTMASEEGFKRWCFNLEILEARHHTRDNVQHQVWCRSEGFRMSELVWEQPLAGLRESGRT